ncbi:hypothetical protein AMQ84_01365 [Paenibacillus riograndensis]|uniref:Teneurin-like YD-shell domain-containing protein n=1 Tax=Paenibacillus riograndensis TaxID=483937 RepID=A0A132UBD6_9BACL|nr:hypothetical protein AMQ84_01365 [Paenibacillus riograndensis]
MSKSATDPAPSVAPSATPKPLFSTLSKPEPTPTPENSEDLAALSLERPIADEVVSVSGEVYALKDPGLLTILTLKSKIFHKKAQIQSGNAEKRSSQGLSRSIAKESSDLSQADIEQLVQAGASKVDVYWLNFLVMGQTKWTPLELLKWKQEKNLPWEDIQKDIEKESGLDVGPSVEKDVYTEASSDAAWGKRSLVMSSVYGPEELAGSSVALLAQSSITAFDAAVSSVINDVIVRSQINQVQKPQYNDRNTSSEVVDPSSGSLNRKENLIHLPGVDGLDLDIGVKYNSNQGMSFIFRDNWNDHFQMWDRSYGYVRPMLGVGWSFQFPSLDYVTPTDIYYHEGNGNVYKLGQNDELSNYTYLMNYKGKDKRFVFEESNNGQFTNGQVKSSSYLEYSDLKREYFSRAGDLIGIVDRFGNAITFNYTDGILSSIKDTTGRVVTFTIEPKVDGKIEIIVNDGNSEAQRVILKRKKVQANIEYGVGIPALQTDVPVLSSITNQIGEETTFDYENNMSMYSSYGFIFTSMLRKVNYPYNKSNTNYEYEPALRRLNSYENILEYRMKSRSDFTGSKAYQQINYSYIGDYTGNNPNEFPLNLPDDFRYSTATTVVSSSASNGLTTTNTFDKEGRVLRTETREPGGERKVTTNTAFHGLFTQLPTQTTISEYSAQDSDATANHLYSETGYNEWGQVVSQTKPLTGEKYNNPVLKQRYTTTYQYEPKYHLISAVTSYQNESDATPATEQYTYTSEGRPATVTNALGEQTIYSYSYRNGTGGISQSTAEKTSNGRVVAKNVTVYGTESRHAYPTEQQQWFNLGQPDQQVVKTQMSYEMGKGLLKSKTEGNLQTTSYEYDLLGRLKKETHPVRTNTNGERYSEVIDYNYYNQTSVNFDAVNAGTFVLKVNTIKTVTNLSTHDAVITNSDALYNGLGLLLLEEHHDDNAGKWVYQQYHYDDMGRPVYSIDPAGNTLTVSYDAWGRQNRATNANGDLIVSDYSFKARTNTSYIQDKNTGEKLNYVQDTYDAWGNKISASTYKDWPTNQQQITESYRYDIAGNITGYTDPNHNVNEDGVTTTYAYDALGRLSAIKDALNQTTNYSYDGNGQVSKVTIQAKNGSPQTLNTKTYNELGLLKVKQDGASQNESYTYNSAGQLAAKTDRNGSTFGYTYDESGQLKKSTISGMINNVAQTQETNVIFGEGAPQKQTIETRTNNTLTATQTQTLDSLGQVRNTYSLSGNHSAYIGNQRDVLGRMTQINDNYMGFYTNYLYNKQRLDKVQTNGGSTLTSDASANVQYSYYANNLVNTIAYPTLTDGSKIVTTYTYNEALGWIESITNTKRSSVLSGYSYSYDNNGNRITVSESRNDGAAQTTSYTYDALNRLVSITRPDGGKTTYTYDVRGNRQTLSDTSNVSLDPVDTSYTYDLQNTLTSVTKGGSTTSFKYYADGLRFMKTNGSTQTQVNYNLNGEVISQEKIVSGVFVEQANFVRGDRVLVKKDKKNNSVTDYYYLYNGHGDVVQIVDTSGAVINNYTYDEWGNITSQVEGTSNSFKYTGEVYDPETGLYYLRARYYDPSMGRFLNEDTVEGQIDNPLSLNLYTYVENNPLIYSDPTGQRKTESYYEIEMLINAAMKGNSSFKNNLSDIYGHVYDDKGNTFRYLYGLLTQTSPYENSAGNASWAKGQLLNAYEAGQDKVDKNAAYVLAAADIIVGGVAGLTKSTQSLFRAVSPEEFYQIMKTGTFEIGDGMQTKQFGLKLEEVLKYANQPYNTEYAAIIKVSIGKDALKNLAQYSTSIDSSIFKSGVFTIQFDKLEEFNKLIKAIEQAL